MATAERLTYEQLESRLHETEGIIGALCHHEVDAIVGEGDVALVRLKEVEESLRQAHEELEQRIEERTAELEQANQELREVIEEQRRMRRRLEASEHKYRELVENANSIIMRRDPEGRITFFNEYAQRFFGYREQEILGRNAVGTIIPEIDSNGADRAAIFHGVSRNPEEHPTTEGESVRREGPRVWISWTHKPIRDESGQLVEILSVGNDVTQLKEAERALQQTQARLLKAQQIARIGNWEVQLEGHAVWWSDEMYRLLGLEPGQVGPTCELMSSLTHPDDREAVTNMVRDAIENRRPSSMDHRIVRADGQERFMHSDVEIISDVNGAPVRTVGTMQCITERKLAELHLEQSASQLRDQAELLDLAHDMIFVHDMEGKIIFWNRGAEHSYGWKRQEAQGQLSHQLLQTEYCEPLIRITAKIVREGRWEGELIHTTRDGRKITVASRWALRRGPGGRPVAILEIDNDITDRKHVEREMARAKRFAESIVNTIQESLVVLDPQLRVVSANRSFHETFGTAAGQVEGKPFSALDGWGCNAPVLLDRLARVLPQNAGFEDFEIECTLADGQVKWLTIGAWPIRGPAGGAETILLVMQDVTIRRQHEDEIRRDKEQLAALAEELLLTEERQRQRVAAALHDSISQSLAFAKREISALERKVPDAMREPLEQACGQIAEAIEQTRNLTLELAPSILYTLGLEAAIEDLAEQFANCDGFVCSVQATEESKPLNDQVKSLLYRAVRELLVNVSKHAQAKSVSIVVERNGDEIRITVEDDGKGFDPNRVKPTSVKGGGFGIFSIRQRLTYVGGKLLVESAEGRGAKVTLTAPLNV